MKKIKYLALLTLALGSFASCSQTLSETPPPAATPKMIATYKSALAGDSDSLVSVGISYWDGSNGFPVNKRSAANAFEIAAKQGDPLGCYLAGMCYLGGQGRMQSYDKARTYLQISYAYGYDKAAESLELLEKTIAQEEAAEAQQRYNAQMEQARQVNKIMGYM